MAADWSNWTTTIFRLARNPGQSGVLFWGIPQSPGPIHPPSRVAVHGKNKLLARWSRCPVSRLLRQVGLPVSTPSTQLVSVTSNEMNRWPRYHGSVCVRPFMQTFTSAKIKNYLCATHNRALSSAWTAPAADTAVTTVLIANPYCTVRHCRVGYLSTRRTIADVNYTAWLLRLISRTRWISQRVEFSGNNMYTAATVGAERLWGWSVGARIWYCVTWAPAYID